MAQTFLATLDDLPESDDHDRYVRGEMLGEGGMGRVWEGHDAHLKRLVALKELKPTHQHDLAFRHRLLTEARVTGCLEHPGIIPVYDVVEPPGGAPFYTMRLVRGRTLGKAIADYHAKRRSG